MSGEELIWDEVVAALKAVFPLRPVVTHNYV
jgi:hypothetical protein